MKKGGLYSSFYKMQFREEAGLSADALSSTSNKKPLTNKELKKKRTEDPKH
jgi:hypothetical protein